MGKGGNGKVVGRDNTSDDKELMLNGDQLQTLAKLIHYQEVDRIKSIPFSSEIERGQYLRDSRDAYVKSVDLMAEAADLHREDGHKPTIGEVVLHYLHYVEYFFNTGLRLMWNLHLRLELIGKLRDHATSDLIPHMESIKERLASGELDPEEIEALEAEAKELVKKLTAFENTHHQIMIDRETAGPRNFSKALNKKGISFEKLVQEHQQKLIREKGSEYGGLFEELDDAKKIEVYDDIVTTSGRTSLLSDKASLFLDGAGIAILLITVGLMAWDIYSSDHKVQTATVDGASLVASMVGSFGGEFVGAAIGTAIAATTVGAETAATVAAAIGIEVAAVSSAFVCLTAVVTGIGAAIALGAFAGWLVTKIFSTGGKHASKVVTVQGQNSPPPPPKPLPLSMQNVRTYVAPMPNGDVLARQLTYKGA